MDRVIGCVPAHLDDLYEPVEVASCLLDRGYELVLREMMRAGARDKNAVAWQQLHRELVQFPVGRLPLRDVAAALDERGRIDDDDVELLASLPQRRERVECVTALRTNLEAALGRGLLQQLEGRCR